MKNPNLFTAQLKLKRHNLSFQILEEETLQLGGTLNIKKQFLLTVILPFIAGATLIMFEFLFDIGLIGVLGAFILLYPSYNIVIIKKKKANNKNTKIIGNGELKIISPAGEKVFSKASLKELTNNINLVSKETYEGQILVKSLDNTEYVILSINDKNKKLLEEDLDYLTRFIELKLSVD